MPTVVVTRYRCRCRCGWCFGVQAIGGGKLKETFAKLAKLDREYAEGKTENGGLSVTYEGDDKIEHPMTAFDEGITANRHVAGRNHYFVDSSSQSPSSQFVSLQKLMELKEREDEPTDAEGTKRPRKTHLIKGELKYWFDKMKAQNFDETMFEQMDTNNDGVLSAEEFGQGIRSSCCCPKPKRDGMDSELEAGIHNVHNEAYIGKYVGWETCTETLGADGKKKGVSLPTPGTRLLPPLYHCAMGQNCRCVARPPLR